MFSFFMCLNFQFPSPFFSVDPFHAVILFYVFSVITSCIHEWHGLHFLLLLLLLLPDSQTLKKVKTNKRVALNYIENELTKLAVMLNR
jgi:hypothetical protein